MVVAVLPRRVSLIWVSRRPAWENESAIVDLDVVVVVVVVVVCEVWYYLGRV
jgi:hypothetical protein